jgi:hypothetical protein
MRSIVILVAMAAGTAFALDHPRLPHRVLHVISPVQLKATCPAGGRKYRAANPQKDRERKRKWRAANPEKAREHRRRWRAANLKKARDYQRLWRAAKKDKINER